jgi:hypothetical protein
LVGRHGVIHRQRVRGWGSGERSFARRWWLGEPIGCRQRGRYGRLLAGHPRTSALPDFAAGPSAGNPDKHCEVPVEARAADTSNPDRVVGTGSAASCTSAAFVGSAIFFVSNSHQGMLDIQDSAIRDNTGGDWNVLAGISMHEDTRQIMDNSTIE